jgi:hypothetical protein
MELNITKVNALIIGLFIFLIMFTGCTAKYSPAIEVSIGTSNTTTTIPTISPDLSDSEIVKAGVLRYFTYKSFYGLPSSAGIIPENATLTKLATENANNGVHSLKIKGNTPEEAIKVFETYEDENFGDSAAFWQHNWHVSGSAIYGVGVSNNYRDQYNICIVFATPQKSTTNITPDGAYVLVEHPDDITYLWS